VLERWGAACLGLMFAIWVVTLHLPLVLRLYSFLNSPRANQWSSLSIAIARWRGSWALASRAESPSSKNDAAARNRARIFPGAGTVVRDEGRLDMDIANKTILITGANRGIGRALVNEVLKRGAKKVYEGTRGSLQIADERVVPLTLDVTNVSQIQRAVDQVDTLDVLINNAGGRYLQR